MSKIKEKTKSNKKMSLPAWKEAVPRWLARILFFAAIWSLIVEMVDWLMPPVGVAISTLLSFINLPSNFSIFNAVVLFILASSIRHRRRLALWLVIIYFQLAYFVIGAIILTLQIIGLINDLGINAGEIIWIVATMLVSVVLAILLIRARQAFPTKVLSGIWWKAVAVSVSGLILSVLTGLALSLVIGKGSIQSQFPKVMADALSNFKYLVPFGTELISFKSENNYWVSLVISLIMLSGFLVSFLLFIRSGQRDLSSSPDHELALRKLILEYGQHDSLSYFATRRDKAVIFSKNGKAAIAYALFGSTLIAGGDPIGDKSAWKDAGKAFLEIARTHGWTPAIVGVSEEGVAFYRKLGLTSALFGDEAVVVVKDFSLENPALRDLTKVMRRAERENYSVSVRRQSDIPQDELNEMIRLVDIWRNDGPERGFSMTSSRFGDPTDSRMMIVTAFDSQNQAQGILSFVPVGNDCLSLDTMRRSPEAMNGVTSFMIVSLIEAARKLGIQEISLNFAAVRRIFVNGEQAYANSVERAARRVMLFFSKWYQLESLYRANDIYLPEWRPRWICMDRGASLTEVLLAIGQAEGFVPVNVFSRLKNFFRRHIVSSSDGWWTSEDFIQQVQADEISFENPAEEISIFADDRLEKLKHLRELKIDPYPSLDDFEDRRSVKSILKQYQEVEELPEISLTLSGRLMSLRGRGALCFADLQEGASKIQLMLKRDDINLHAENESRPEDFSAWKSNVNVGDIVTVQGSLMRTQTGELSLKIAKWQMLAKSLQGSLELSQEENAAAYTAIETQSVVESSIRENFKKRGYIETDGAVIKILGRGFNSAFFLKEKVESFELFTHADDQMKLAQSLIKDALAAAQKTEQINFEGKLVVVSFYTAISQALQTEISVQTREDELRQLCSTHGIEKTGNMASAELVIELYKHLVKKKTQEPIFYVDFPVGAGIEAASKQERPGLVEKWELVAFGETLAIGSTALTDPSELQSRLTVNRRADEGLMLALSYGLPPFGQLELNLALLLNEVIKKVE